jgi:hypothetical protein
MLLLERFITADPESNKFFKAYHESYTWQRATLTSFVSNIFNK